MSLIEEALRKHRAEQSAKKPDVAPVAGADAAPARPPTLPEDRGHSKSRTLLLVALNLLLVAAVLAAIGWGAWRLLMTRAGQAPTTFQIGAGGVVATGAATATHIVASAITSTQHIPNAVTVANPASTLLSAESGNEVAASVITVIASASQTPARVTSVTTTIPPAPPPPPPVHPVWPHLSVSGIMEAPGNRSTAIVNGKILRQGDRIKGTIITAISRNGVTFEFEGESRRIRTGNTAE